MSRRLARSDRGAAGHPCDRLKTSTLPLPFGTVTIDAQPNGKPDHYHPSCHRDLRKEAVTQLLIDSQSVRSADTVPAVTRGFDAGKKVKGRKRFIVTDTLGLLLAVHVVGANIQDRDGARRPLLWTRLDHPGVRKVWADQGFAGRLVGWTASVLGRELAIVRKDPDRRGFQVQPKRWAIERTFSWITAHRRLARDYETSPARSETMIRWAMIGIMLRRLT